MMIYNQKIPLGNPLLTSHLLVLFWVSHFSICRKYYNMMTLLRVKAFCVMKAVAS